MQVVDKAYFYGVLRSLHDETLLMPFVVRAVKGAPLGALVVREMHGTADQAKALAYHLVKQMQVVGDTASLLEPSPLSQEEEVEIVPGSVARYHDQEMHFAIVLRCGPLEHEALFLTSSNRWTLSRRATREELALCGFVSRHATYLGLVRRSALHFVPTGLTFPEHRLEALLREFLPPSGAPPNTQV